MARIRTASKKTPRQKLDRDRIAATALRQIDEAGLSGLSMRKLGAALGVEAMALYHHFPSKGQLLDAVVEQLVQEMGLPQGECWLERLADGARRYRGIAVAHPRAFVLMTTRRAATDHTLTVFERILETFAEGGFDAPLRARLFRLLGYYVGGAGHAEIASRGTGEDATPLLMEAGPDPARFPLLAATAPHLRVSNLDAVFEFGLAIIIDAIRAAARDQSGALPSREPSGDAP